VGRLIFKACAGLAFLMAVMAALVFIPAGTIDYWQGWTFLAVYFAASVAISLYLIVKDRALMERRMSGGPTAEKEPAQRIIMGLASAGFVGLVLVPALDHRFGWSQIPAAVVLAGDGLMLVGWLVIYFVFKANSFAAATVEVASDQTVVSTGPYALVRHPMYAGALVLLVGIPISLGSWWGLPIIPALAPVLIWRLLDEERMLARDLPGYADYQRKQRWRLIPGIW